MNPFLNPPQCRSHEQDNCSRSVITVCIKNPSLNYIFLPQNHSGNNYSHLLELVANLILLRMKSQCLSEMLTETISFIDMQQDLTGHFQCPVCLQTAKEAVESSCCTKIFCLVCIQSSLSKYGCCPCCRSTECKLQENRYARKIISQLKVPCQYCRAHVETGEMSQHLLKCPEVVTECSFCKNSFKQAEIVQHSLLVHKQETKDKLLELLLQNRAESQKKVKGGNEISSLRNSEEEEEQNWFGKKINRDGRMAIFGTVAKYYCGGKLIGKCKCCDGNCGPDNGENCDACMEMDIKRMRLPRGFLVNAHGYPSKCTDQNPYCTRTIKERGGLFSSTDKKCTPLTRCSECETLRFSLLLGRYKNLY